MGFFSRWLGSPPPIAGQRGAWTSIAKRKFGMAIAGHGMVFAPVCPCRILVGAGETLDIVLGDTDEYVPTADATIDPGIRPASKAPTQQSPELFEFGFLGPRMALKPGLRLEDVFSEFLAGIDMPWTVLVPGCMFGIPSPDVIVQSPSPDSEFPMFVLADAPPGTFMWFDRDDTPAAELEIDTEDGAILVPTTVVLREKAIRRWEYRFAKDGVHRIRQHYALPFSDTSTIVMGVEAPESHWQILNQKAMVVAWSYDRIGDD